MSAREPLLAVDRLCVDYTSTSRQLRAVDDVSLQLAAGGSLGIAGASGSGKTTVSMALLGLLDPRATQLSGSIRFDGQDLTTMDDAAWRGVRGRRIGAIFQSPQGTFNPTMTIGQHLEEALLCTGASRAEASRRAMEMLERVGMPRRAEVLRNYAFELSGGMCQRAAIALALSQEPTLLIADEPTSSLDVIAQVEICQLLKQLHTDQGLSLIVISHDLGLIGQLVEEVAVMNQGCIVEAGPTASVFSAPRHSYTRQLLSAGLDMTEGSHS